MPFFDKMKYRVGKQFNLSNLIDAGSCFEILSNKKGKLTWQRVLEDGFTGEKQKGPIEEGTVSFFEQRLKHERNNAL